MDPGLGPALDFFGGFLVFVKSRLRSGMIDEVSVAHSLNLLMSKGLMKHVHAWEEDGNTVKDMLGAARKSDFEKKRDGLVRAIGKGLGSMIADFQATAGKAVAGGKGASVCVNDTFEVIEKAMASL